MTDRLHQDKSGGSAGSVRLAEMVADSGQGEARQPFSGLTLAKLGLLGGLLVCMNLRQFPMLVRVWGDDPNWSHGFLIPLFSVYLIYCRFGEISTTTWKRCLLGLPAVIFCGLAHVLAYRIQNPWSCQVTMVMLGASLVLYLAGWRMFKLLWLPIVFLVFAFPVPGIYYTRIALPLQNLAAAGATAALKVVGVEIEVISSSLWIISRSGIERSLTVAEACSGMRLLMAFLALSVAMAYLTNRPLWQRVVLVLLGIPVAIACNVFRVAITSSMYVIDKPELGVDFMHEFTGMLMLIPAALLLWLVSYIMRVLFIEEDVEAVTAAGGES